MNDPPLEALNDILRWLRTIPWPQRLPTLSTAESIFTPFILAALAFHIRNAWVMWRLYRSLSLADEDLRVSASDRLHRSLRGTLRLVVWALIAWALIVNNPFSNVVFTFGAIAYAITEFIDGLLDWLYQRDRERYWREKDKEDSLAIQIAKQAAQAAHELLMAVEQNTHLTQKALESSEASRVASHQAEEKAAEALEVGNHANIAIENLGSDLKKVRVSQDEVVDTQHELADSQHQLAATQERQEHTQLEQGGRQDEQGHRQDKQGHRQDQHEERFNKR